MAAKIPTTMSGRPYYDLLDEDGLESDSNIAVPTQQSVKAYVDTKAGEAPILTTPVYEDLQVSIANVKLPASNAPTWRYYNHGITDGVEFPVLGFAVGSYMFFDVQTSHSMALLTVLDNHIHYMTPTDATGKKIKLQLDVIAAGISGTWAAPTGSPFTKEISITSDLTGSHVLAELADIPAVNTTVSSVYSCRLKRIAASADEYSGELYLKFTDCHYQKDTMGSATEGAK